ncbi:dienelactone hydrolase family protein, partial [Alcanivoracaceae bacterium MT1]
MSARVLPADVLKPAPSFLGRIGGDAAGQLERSVDARSVVLERRHREAETALADGGALRRHQAAIRRKAAVAIRMTPLDLRGTDAHVIASRDLNDLVVETVQIDAAVGGALPLTILRRHGSGAKPAVLVIPGHGPRRGARILDLAAAIASGGVVVAVMEVWGAGERSEFRDMSGESELRLEPDDILPVREHNAAGMALWAVGESLARAMVVDAQRALAYLRGRRDVDANRLGVTGPSGGGLVTSWLMMLDPDIRAAAPLIFISDQAHIRASGIPQCSEQIALGDGEAWIDHSDALVAMAPRPVLVASGDHDFFPVEGAAATVARGRHAYRLVGAEAQLRRRRFSCGHDLPPEMALEVARFFAEVLRADTTPEWREGIWPADELAATRSGFASLDDAAGSRLHAHVRRRQEAGLGESTAESAVAWLRERIRARHIDGVGHIRWTSDAHSSLDGVPVRRRTGFWPGSRHGVSSAGVLIEPPQGADDVVVALFDRGTRDLSEHRRWVVERVAQGSAVLALDVPGMGSVAPRARN